MASEELCLPEQDYSWAYNDAHLSPCQVASSILRSNLWRLEPGAGSYPSTGLQPNSKTCSSFFYALISACADCQGANFLTWEKWTELCIGAGITPNPHGIDGVDIGSALHFIPLWAHWNAGLNPVFLKELARKIALSGVQEIQRPGLGTNEGPVPGLAVVAPPPGAAPSGMQQTDSFTTRVVVPPTQTNTETSGNTGITTAFLTSRPPKLTQSQAGTEPTGRPGGNTGFPPAFTTATTSGLPVRYTTDHSSPSPSPTGPEIPGPVSASSSSTNVAAIVGGVIAGLVLLLLLVILVLWALRRRQRRRVAPSAAYLAAGGSRPVMTMLQQPRRESMEAQTPLFNDVADANSSIRFSQPLPHVFLDDVLTPPQSPPTSGTSTSFFTRSSRDGYQPLSA